MLINNRDFIYAYWAEGEVSNYQITHEPSIIISDTNKNEKTIYKIYLVTI